MLSISNPTAEEITCCRVGPALHYNSGFQNFGPRRLAWDTLCDHKVGSERSRAVARIRTILHGKAAGNAGLRAAVHKLRQDGHFVEMRVTWEPGDAARMTAEAIAEA